MAKSLPTELKSLLDSVVKMVNIVKSRSHVLMCHEAGSQHDALVLHANIHWLSKGKVLARFYELRNELLNLLIIENPNFAALLNNEEWCAKMAYLTDIFSH